LSGRKSVTRIAFTPEGDGFLIKMKEKYKLKREEIQRRFIDRFPSPKRTVGCLQVHYCAKLKRRAVEEG
jgi:hypothetical protein